MSLRAEIESALAEAGARPLHRFGQNFMVDEVAVKDLIAAAHIAEGSRVVEIGPGTGVVTTRLMAAGATVCAVEIDHGLSAWLRRVLVPRGLHLIEGDCLASKEQFCAELLDFCKAGAWTLCSNLPYDVAIPVILNACALPIPPQRIAVTVQRECAQRLVSQPGSDAWGASAAVARSSGDPQIVRVLGPSSFTPRPRVDSAILALSPQRVLPPGYPAFVRSLFAYRRKVLPRAVRDTGHDRDAAERALAAARLDFTRRVETLLPDELIAVFHALSHAS